MRCYFAWGFEMTYEIPKARSYDDPALFTLEQLTKYLELQIAHTNLVIDHGEYASFVSDSDNKVEINKYIYNGMWLALTKFMASLNIHGKGLKPVNYISNEDYQEQLKYLDDRINAIKLQKEKLK